MAKMYNKTPSEMLSIDDDYLSYCLNEACYLICARMQNKEEPIFKKKVSSFRELYEQYEN